MPGTDSGNRRSLESRLTQIDDQLRRRRGRARSAVHILGSLPNVKATKSKRSFATESASTTVVRSPSVSKDISSTTYNRIDSPRNEAQSTTQSTDKWKQVGWQVIVCGALVAFFVIAYTAITGGRDSSEGVEAGEGIDIELPAEFDLNTAATNETTLAPTSATPKSPSMSETNIQTSTQTETQSRTKLRPVGDDVEQENMGVIKPESDEYTVWQHPDAKATEQVQDTVSTYPTTDRSKYPEASALEAKRQTGNRPGMATLRGVIQPPPYQDRSRR